MSKGSSQFTFAQVPRADIPRSTFNRSHNYKTTFDSGYLIPFYVDEALPGDTFNVHVSAFARLATPLVPIMDNMYMDLFFFAVPNRLVWNNWQKFCGEQEDPGDSTDYVVPQVSMPVGVGYAEGSIYDYMGIQPEAINVGNVNALHLRAYNLIWNEWFRDQNLQASLTVEKGDGPDPATRYNLVRRGKRHDYFTSCLPWPQKGPGVDIPIGGIVPNSTTIGPTFQNSAGTVAGKSLAFVGGSTGAVWNGGSPAASGDALWQDPNLKVAAGTINDLRQAVQIQRLLERDARGGTRYVELLKAHFGVTSPDARLQRPEFLGGGSIPVNINPVAQTSGTANDPDTGYTKYPQGNLAGYGVAAGSNGFVKSFVEHCVIIGLVSVRADMTYQSSLNRMWSRRTRYDYFWPALAHLGEQAVLQKELDCRIAAPNTVFGYQERWAEYRYHPSLVTAKFRSSAQGTLDYWHLAQNFNNPTLNATFIEENPPIDRVIAVPGTVQDPEPQFLFDSHFRVKCARPMPLYSVPGLMDHF